MINWAEVWAANSFAVGKAQNFWATHKDEILKEAKARGFEVHYELKAIVHFRKSKR